MGSSMSFLKNLLIPALISLALYILLSSLIYPFFRHYRQRYSQYLPLEAISSRTRSFRDRVADGVMRVFLPSTWSWSWWGRGRRRGRESAAGAGAPTPNSATEEQEQEQNDNVSIFDEEGEIMVGMNVDAARREAIERGRHGESGGRLSRDLEEGFMDDSEDEEVIAEMERRRNRGIRR